jgi:hypothetical protein
MYGYTITRITRSGQKSFFDSFETSQPLTEFEALRQYADPNVVPGVAVVVTDDSAQSGWQPEADPGNVPAVLSCYDEDYEYFADRDRGPLTR